MSRSFRGVDKKAARKAELGQRHQQRIKAHKQKQLTGYSADNAEWLAWYRSLNITQN